jgi:ATP-dependent DNA helicase RecG
MRWRAATAALCIIGRSMPRTVAAAAPPHAPHRADDERTGARAFASKRETTRSELLAAPVRWPRPSRLQQRLDLPAGKLADGLRTLGIESVGALLEHLPRDSRDARCVRDLRPNEAATIAVQVRAIAARPVRRRGMKPLVEATVFDETGSTRATFFNQPWLAQRYKPGTRLVLHGKLTPRGTFGVAHHALGSDMGGDGAGRDSAGGGDRPQAVAHYAATEGVSSTQILALVRDARPALQDVPEALPAATRAAERLPTRASALAALHFPRHAQDGEGGRRRLAFEELLLTQLVFLHRRARRRALAILANGAQSAPVLADPPTLSARWLARELPFALTADQRRAVDAVRADLARRCPMQRLLMGEVGSGKTVVALYAMLRAVEHGHQAALMAPTETLAEQHFATLQRLIGGESVSAALLTGSTPAKRRAEILGRLASGELSLLVGTHALIEPEVRFRALSVAVVDEQHRFGVRQRTALTAQGGARPPHTLHMTATPIPRTLALAQYGDLDISVLRELPRGRQAIDTHVLAGERGRARAYERLREQLEAGRQGYVVCPLIEQGEVPQADVERAGGDRGAAGGAGEAGGGAGHRAGADGASELRAASAEFERLARGELQGHELVLLHGGRRPREKQQAMAAFASGRAQVLVATTVIEVGIDVPNATVMVVENAERFGLSQLHQLRGRVGRGEHRAACYLIGSPGSQGSARLRALARHSDGFRLAEIDLELRKEGELVGTRQSGLGQFEVASLPEDALLLERARARAQEILTADPELKAPEHALLGETLQSAFGAEALEPIPA